MSQNNPTYSSNLLLRMNRIVHLLLDLVERRIADVRRSVAVVRVQELGCRLIIFQRAVHGKAGQLVPSPRRRRQLCLVVVIQWSRRRRADDLVVLVRGADVGLVSLPAVR